VALIHIENTSAARLVGSMGDNVVDFVHADPPWEYRNGGGERKGKRLNGAAQGHYVGDMLEQIVEDLACSHRVSRADTYLAVWVTIPLLFEFVRAIFVAEAAGEWRWQYLTGGAWGKIDRRMGIGFHLRGSAELLLIFRKGKPKPRASSPISNLWTSDEDGVAWLESRSGHSEKPAAALEDLVRLATRQSEHVLDLYAGESASLARVCHLQRRRYTGAELDPKRCAKARAMLEAVRA
jgi:N6-adenosine-specific RNA methylase IME4